MFRLEYNQLQKMYHVAFTSEPLIEGWNVILDNSTREEIDVVYFERIKKKKR